MSGKNYPLKTLPPLAAYLRSKLIHLKRFRCWFFNEHFKEIAVKKYITYLGLTQSEILIPEESNHSEEAEPSEEKLTPKEIFKGLLTLR